jgi:hypothetical protein
VGELGLKVGSVGFLTNFLERERLMCPRCHLKHSHPQTLPLSCCRPRSRTYFPSSDSHWNDGRPDLRLKLRPSNGSRPRAFTCLDKLPMEPRGSSPGPIAACIKLSSNGAVQELAPP